MIEFAVSGVETYWWLPIMAALVISCLTSTGGVSGAFLLLPFQVSVLGFAGPAVSSTNLVYNMIAIPSGVFAYNKEKRLVWPLAGSIILGSVPGLFIGALIRVSLLSNPAHFKIFVGVVLLYIAFRLVQDVIGTKGREYVSIKEDSRFDITSIHFSARKIEFAFKDKVYSVRTPMLWVLCFIVGIVGGIYGIGGGAIIAPFLVAIFGLPVYAVAGAALFGTFVTSASGILIYTLLGSHYSSSGLTVSPDWLLGALFGIGGAVGMYIGARIQRYLPQRLIKIILALGMLSISVRYFWEFFL